MDEWPYLKINAETYFDIFGIKKGWEIEISTKFHIVCFISLIIMTIPSWIIAIYIFDISILTLLLIIVLNIITHFIVCTRNITVYNRFYTFSQT